MCHRGGLRLRGDDAAYGEAFGPRVGVSVQSHNARRSLDLLIRPPQTPKLTT